MKRIISAILVFAMIFSFCACSRKNNDENITETNTSEAISDEEALNRYIDKINSGKYIDESLYGGIDISSYITLGEYKNLEYPSDPLVAKEASYDEAAEYYDLVIFENFADKENFETLESGTVQKFDSITIDYEGFVDGKKIEDACDTDDEITIGSGDFIEGFEEALLGKAIGAETTINLTFSKYFNDDEVAGKDVIFNVKIKSAKRYKMPEVTLEMINEKFKTSFASKEEVIAQMQKDLTKDKIANRYDYIVEYLTKKIMASSTFSSYPEKAIEFYKKSFRDYYESYASEYDTEGVTEEKLIQAENEYSENAVKNDLIIHAIAEKEKLSISDDELKKSIESSYREAAYFSDMNTYIDYCTKMNGLYYFVEFATTVAVSDLIYDSAIEK